MTDTQYKIYIDDVIKRVEDARLKVSPHHIVKIVAVSKYSTSKEIQKLYAPGLKPMSRSSSATSQEVKKSRAHVAASGETLSIKRGFPRLPSSRDVS